MKTKSSGKNYKAIEVGDLNKLSTYRFLHPKLKQEVEGKVFVGEALATTGAELSFTELPPKTTIPFLHQHRNNEEIYVILRGYGKFQVDDDVFDISEGSVIRVSPGGNRTLYNEASHPMVYLVIQARENSLVGYNISDGFRTEGQILI
ncbi:cupin domain-containing protein [Anaerophaga thermohalophila]|jgi:mannose-6-phosphate isomerase-like protein (cupin superfamily)|uniref:cupin domain-containing protein n=1 Tax=Anaerophaga thermohalophila TaxID=177400 RepID=UPI0003191BCC|nr:cupin domain-containing protein [Anaerophaga thermohalophila]